MGWNSLHFVEYSRVNDFLYSKKLPAWKAYEKLNIVKQSKVLRLNSFKIQSCLKAVDVTWRYSPKHDEICRRRLMVSEEWLVRALSMLNHQVSIQTT